MFVFMLSSSSCYNANIEKCCTIRIENKYFLSTTDKSFFLIIFVLAIENIYLSSLRRRF
jgi:hypothetical protein